MSRRQEGTEMDVPAVLGDADGEVRRDLRGECSWRKSDSADSA